MRAFRSIDFSKYDLTDPNITMDYLAIAEDCARNTIVEHLKKNGISLSGRGCSDRALQSRINRPWKVHKENPFRFRVNQLYMQWRNRAVGRGYDWAVSLEDILSLWQTQGGKCSLTGEALILDKQACNISLDRIDSSKDYISGNIQLVLIPVNYMKNSLPQAELIRLCKLISQRHP